MMVNKSTKRFSVFCTSVVLSIFLSGIPKAVEAGPIPAYILVPVTIHALGYALPRINKKLTPQQRQQLQDLRSETYKQVEAVLTKAQRSRIVQGMRSRQNISKLVKSLQLTPQQKARIQSIVKTSRQKIQVLLSEDTPSAIPNSEK